MWHGQSFVDHQADQLALDRLRTISTSVHAREALGRAVPAKPRDDLAMRLATMHDLADGIRWIQQGDWIGCHGQTVQVPKAFVG